MGDVAYMCPVFGYHMGGSCGYVKLDVSVHASKFRLRFKSRWMGMKEDEVVTIDGTVTEHQKGYMRLVSEGGGHADLYWLENSLDFQGGDTEHECMCMANGAKVNENGTYNALLMLHFSRDIEGAGKNWRDITDDRVVKGFAKPAQTP